ncbi:MAG: DUF3515 domain-containing protein [Micromonosporaceae bacterium]
MASQDTRTAAMIAAVVAVPVAVLVGIGAFALLSRTVEDTGPVDMPARELTARQELVCRALVSQLPDTVRDLAPRPVTAGPEQNAAYGDPPITLACGVPPAEVAPTDHVWGLDGVCWVAAEQDDGTVWVTVDREVPVRVTVPSAYGGPGQWVAEFSRALAETVPPAPDPPTGCPG